jgi:hypothetical protein
MTHYGNAAARIDQKGRGKTAWLDVFCDSSLSTSCHVKGTAMNTLHLDMAMVHHGVR